MPIALRVESGSLSSKAIGLPLGQTIRVGREHPSDLVVGDDGMMSRVHFEIAFDGKSIWLRDLRSTNGTFLNRNPVFQAELRGNDEIRAGRTVFRVVVEADAPAEETSQKQDAAPIAFDRLLGLMRGELQPLYAVLDAARDPEIFKLLSHSDQPYYWLFEGEESAKLSLFAPYLVPLAPESPLLEMLLHRGWGKSWGTFLSSHAAIHELQWFLRRLLTAMLPDGTAVLLRYYDPRVLRTLIASSTARQLHILFGRVLHYLIEAEEPEFALAFSISPKGLRTIRMPLGKQGEAKVELTQPLPETQSGSAVDYVYRLRHEQMNRLEANKTDGMAGALLEDIRKFYPDDFAANGKVRIEALIRHACQRAPKYGIQAQADLLVYVVVMLHCGMYFDVDPIHPWSSQILTMRLKPGDKMERLKVAASKAHKHNANESIRLIPKLPGVQPLPAAERNDIR